MLTPCEGCRRHVRGDELACPFCGAAAPTPEVRPVVEGRLSRAMLFAGAVLVAPGCASPPPPSYAQPPPGQSPVDSHATHAPVGSVRGRVTDPAGRPQPRVLVQLAGQHSLSGVTDANGVYTIPRVPPGPYTVTIGHTWITIDVQAEHETVANVTTQAPAPDGFERENPCMPYGAPPSRRRLV